jgi:uracil phosphoribosyltransferase
LDETVRWRASNVVVEVNVVGAASLDDTHPVSARVSTVSPALQENVVVFVRPCFTTDGSMIDVANVRHDGYAYTYEVVRAFGVPEASVRLRMLPRKS